MLTRERLYQPSGVFFLIYVDQLVPGLSGHLCVDFSLVTHGLYYYKMPFTYWIRSDWPSILGKIKREVGWGSCYNNIGSFRRDLTYTVVTYEIDPGSRYCGVLLGSVLLSYLPLCRFKFGVLNYMSKWTLSYGPLGLLSRPKLVTYVKPTQSYCTWTATAQLPLRCLLVFRFLFFYTTTSSNAR